jgi:hypothetical protein
MALNPYEIENADGFDPPEETPATCHGCDQFVNDDPTEYVWFGGWIYHTDCAPVEKAVERDHFNETRR